MVCSSCGRATKAGARFCGGCGASLAPRCPACGAESEPDTRFCEACGASLAAGPAEAAVARKVVTIVFADLIGSTALHERLDPESVSRIMEGYHAAVRAPIEAHGGTLVQLLGDGVMCAFGVPRVAEDDALRAVRAAVEVQQSFREFLGEHSELAGRVGLRVAVNTGEVVVSDDYAAGIGDPLNVAARLQQEAKDGDVLLGESTQRLVAEQVTLARVGTALKGRAEPVMAYRVVSLERPPRAAAVAFVGRDDELRRITEVYDTAIAKPAARLAVLLGSPGLGKSRLLAEFARRLGERATVLTVQCVAGAGATFAPLAEALRAQLRVEEGGSEEALRAVIDGVVPGDDAERARIAAGIGALLAGTPASPEETFFVVRRLLAALATHQPVVLAIDDLQWASPLLLDFTEHLVQWGTGVPLLVLAAARLELRDARSSLTTPGGLVSDVVTLGGLDAGAAMRLAANVIGTGALPAAVAGKVLTASEGNPLFVSELVRMLVNDGALRKDGDRWSLAVDLAELEMPPTIQALLAARIERLRPEERLVLERAAVVGRNFSRAAVTQLLPREAHADLDARLEALRRSELVEADTGWLLGEPALRFHHGLIRDAAYRRVLRGTRAELHGRFADWLESRAGGSVEHDETIGWHLEQAHQHLSEIGPLDANGRALGERAARYLAAAGRRALARDDLQPAAGVLGRALACLGDADPARGDLAVDWCEALLSARDVGPAARAIDELDRFTAGSERLRAWHACFTAQLAVLTDPTPLRAAAAAVEAAAATLAAAGDTAGEAKAHWVQAIALARLGQGGAGEAALDKALAAARRVRGDRRRANEVLAVAPRFALWGPSPVTRASGRCLDVVRVLRITQGAPAVEAVALLCQAVLEALRGRSDAARRMIASSRRLVEELGITQRVLEADVSAGLIELLEGDAIAAERCLRGAYDGLRERGLGIVAAQAAALLGRALLAQGRVGEAEALSHESEALAGDDLKAAIAWRGVRAEALARRGQYEAAIDFARSGVEIAAATDGLLDHADARLALAVALRAAGRSEEAQSEETRAIELWEAKGATLLVERARREAGRGARVDRAPGARVEPPRPESRRVQPNAATAHAARLDAAIAARDTDALAALFGDESETIDHTTGVDFDRKGQISSLRSLLSARDPILQLEPLATLGDSLALLRSFMSGSNFAGQTFDVGAYEKEEIELIEVDALGRRRRSDLFRSDRLGDAVARLYERYAELLPDGTQRTRAAATARSVAGQPMFSRSATESYATELAPEIEFIDHRTVGLGPGRGAETLLRAFRVLRELTETWAARVDDILGLRSDALLVRWTNSGTLRAGGGAYERHLLQLWIFGDDGLVVRWEQFDAEQAVEALARFDELTAARPEAVSRAPAQALRRVGANAATENMARKNAAVAARDADAFSATLADPMEHIDHPHGAVYGREGERALFRAASRARDLSFRHEPIAVLGDSLALSHRFSSASGGAGRTFDVGAYEHEAFVLIEADDRARARRTEVFAPDRLGDAVARLYERYAERLPDGPECVRAAATARSAAAMLGSLDVDRNTAALAPGVEFIDHRPLGLGSSRGAEAFRRGLRVMAEVMADVALRHHDVLDLRSDLLLVRRTTSGTDRAGGGAFERHFLNLWAFGSDGLVTRVELFEGDREAEALARFDELTAEPLAARFANAAWRAVEEWEATMERRDWEGLVARHAPGYVFDDRRSMMRTFVSGEAYLANLRFVFDARRKSSRQLLATRGERLSLDRYVLTSAARHGGLAEFEMLNVVEVDATGRRVASVAFDPEDLDAAYAELDARYAAGEAAPHARTWDAFQRLCSTLAARDWEEMTRGIAPDLVVRDHRLVGLHELRSRDELLASLRAMVALAPDARPPIDHVLALGDRGVLAVGRWMGTREGGPFEIPFISVMALDPTGRFREYHSYDLDQLDAARACFAELAAAPPAPWVENAATRSIYEFHAAWESRDWERVAATCAPGFRRIDRRSMVRLDLDREEHLVLARPLFEMESSRLQSEVLATRGDRLALHRSRFEGTDRDVGPSVIEWVNVIEVDARGKRVAFVLFDPDDLDAAYAELDERYGAAKVPIVLFRSIGARDWDAVAALLASDFVIEDHRLLGWGTVQGPATYIKSLQALVELAPDASLRFDHLEDSGRGMLGITMLEGTREGGAFEDRRVVVVEVDAQGRIRRFEFYDLEDLDAARARFAELRLDPLRISPNAASRARDRSHEAWQARNWDALRALASPDFRFEDRSKIAQLSGDVEMWIENNRFVQPASVERELIGTAGDRIALERALWQGEPDGGPVEREHLRLTEVDPDGRIRASIRFDPGDRSAAFAEAGARFVAGEAAAIGGQAPIVALFRAFTRHDWEAMRGCLAKDAVVHDHRTLSVMGALRGDEWIESRRVLADLAPDVDEEPLRILAWDCHGRVSVGRLFGTMQDGGPFEIPFVGVYLTDGDRVQRYEFFDVADADRALARFEELCANLA